MKLKQWLLLCIVACLIAHSTLFADKLTDDKLTNNVADNVSDNAADDNTGRDDPNILHIYDDIDLVSTIKYQYAKPKTMIKSVYPQLQSDSDNREVSRFNQLVLDKIQDNVHRFTQQVKDSQATNTKSIGRNELYIDYDTSSINPDDNQLISIRFSIQAYIKGMAHPTHQHDVLNYNLDTGEPLELEDLFQADTDYLTVIADYVNQVLAKRLSNKEMLANGMTPTASHFKNWNIKPNGLLFTFDEAGVAPYVSGAQTVLVPYTVLKTIISPDSPIAECIVHKKRCWNNHLLTGGFIDSIGA
jgi:hypothetical protein